MQRTPKFRMFLPGLAVLVLVPALAPTAIRAEAADWPRFLGPTGDAKSAETGLRKSWPPGGPPLRWHKAIGEGYAPPSVAAGRLYLFHRRKTDAILTSMNAETGAEIWQSIYTTDYEDMYGYSNGPRVAPLIDGDRVYTFGAEGRLRCLKVSDGSLIWVVDTARQFGVVQSFFGVGGSPVVEGDLLIVPVGGSPEDSPGISSGKTTGNGSAIVALDKRTGELRYKISQELASYSSPVLTTIGKRRWGLYFARGGLIGFEPTTGKLDFHFPFRAPKLESVNASNPVVVGDMVFITESYGPGSAVVRIKDGGYDVIRQEESRREQSMSSHFMTPIYLNGYLYGSSGQSSGEAELRAVEYTSGKIMWSEPGLGRCTILYADGNLVVFSERGRILLVEAIPKRFHVLADATPILPESDQDRAPADTPESPKRSAGEMRTDEAGGFPTASLPAGTGRPLLTYPAWSPPVLSHGLLYLRGKGRLACFDLTPP
ncbi:MAG: PQQ-binding-like beta-propeller repeat protein [Acidobacteria bacterium]|nr:PQQ-binding-like beta-propeller repeat protein [Acidobacteriota bacterium]